MNCEFAAAVSLGDSPETRGLLAALTQKVQECPERLNSYAIGNALYGLKCLTDSPEVRGRTAKV